MTLQFCLWDFLRDLGEEEVGGAEVIKNIKESGGSKSFDLKSISSTRLRNVARAYAWWISKDCVTLAILKVSILIEMRAALAESYSTACRLYTPEAPDKTVYRRDAFSALHKHPNVDPFDWF